MKEFDYTRALEGEFVTLRNGTKAKILSHFDYQTIGLFANVNEKTTYIGVILDPEQKSILDPDKKSEPMPMMWDRLGRPYNYKSSPDVLTKNDIIGYESADKIIHGVKIKEFNLKPIHNSVYFLATPAYRCLVTPVVWKEHDHNSKHQLKMGLLYPYTQEGAMEATKHSKAMLGIKD